MDPLDVRDLIVQSLINDAEAMDNWKFKELEEHGLLDVARALSEWRDNIG